jgi:hypothetical protein
MLITNSTLRTMTLTRTHLDTSLLRHRAINFLNPFLPRALHLPGPQNDGVTIAPRADQIPRLQRKHLRPYPASWNLRSLMPCLK